MMKLQLSAKSIPVKLGLACLLGWPAGAWAGPPAPASAPPRVSGRPEAADAANPAPKSARKKKARKIQPVQYEAPAEDRSPRPQTAAPGMNSGGADSQGPDDPD